MTAQTTGITIYFKQLLIKGVFSYIYFNYFLLYKEIKVNK